MWIILSFQPCREIFNGLDLNITVKTTQLPACLTECGLIPPMVLVGR